jgi:hypothetical protein
VLQLTGASADGASADWCFQLSSAFRLQFVFSEIQDPPLIKNFQFVYLKFIYLSIFFPVKTTDNKISIILNWGGWEYFVLPDR